MPAQDLYRFTFKDRWGAEHGYTSTLHPATEGRLIAMQLIALGAAPLGALLSTLPLEEFLPSAPPPPPEGQDHAGAGVPAPARAPLSTVLAAAVEGVDLAKVGDSLRDVLMHPAADRLLGAIFSHTQRDAQDLRNSVAFDQAYRGNYTEMVQALWKVIDINGFFPGLDTLQASAKKPAATTPG